MDAKRLLPILGSKILSKSALNRGVEILLNGGKRKPEPPKNFPSKVWQNGALPQAGVAPVSRVFSGY